MLFGAGQKGGGNTGASIFSKPSIYGLAFRGGRFALGVVFFLRGSLFFFLFLNYLKCKFFLPLLWKVVGFRGAVFGGGWIFTVQIFIVLLVACKRGGFIGNV